MNDQLRDIRNAKVEPKAVSLRLPPVKLGTTVQSVLNLSANEWWSRLSASLPISCNFSYPWGEVSLVGANITVTPSVPGKYSFRLPQIENVEANCFSVSFQITVYPDPKTIPVEVKPTPDGPYKKDDDACFAQKLEKMGLFVVGASRRGLSHLADGKFRDDDMSFCKMSETAFVIAVADGAGSAKYSRKGSEIAVNETTKFLSEKLSDKTLASFGDAQWADVLIDSARNAYDKIYEESESRGQLDDTAEDKRLKAFNTTLLVAIVYASPNEDVNVVSFSVGDGAIAWHSKQRTVLMSACDSGQFAGETLFLTARSVWRDLEASRAEFIAKRIRRICIPKAELTGGALLLMSDGVSDPFFASHDDLKEHLDWDKLLKSDGIVKIRRQHAVGDVGAALREWLGFDGGAGHYDDRTLVCVFPEGQDELAESNLA